VYTKNGCHPFLQGSIRFFRFIYSLQQAVQGLSDSLDEIQAVEDHRMLAGGDQGQALGHLAVLDGLDACLLQLVCEVTQFGNLIHLAALSESSGPCVDGSNGVSGGLFTL
jgi:hypothetical protein